MWKSFKSIYFLVGLFSLFFSLIGYPELLDKWIKYLGIKTDMKVVIDQNIIRWIAFAVGMILIGIWSGACKKGWQKLRRSKRDLSTGSVLIEDEEIINDTLSPLKIEVREDGNAYFRVEDEKGLSLQGSKRQVLSIKVHSKEAIDDVKVYISEIETPSFDNDKLQNLLPIRLNFKNVKAGHPVLFSADETQQVDVVSYSSGQKVCDLQLEQFGEGEKPEVFIGSSPICCKIQIKIYGKNVGSSQQSFEIYKKEPLEYNYANNSKQRIFMKRVSNEQQGIIDFQRKTMDSLKEQRRPKLKVNFKQGIPPWVRDKKAKLNGRDYIFSIELMNSGSGNINNPKVRLFIKSSQDDNFIAPWDLQVNNKDIPKTDEEGDGEFVEVLKYFRYIEHKIGDDKLEIIGSKKENNNQNPEIQVQKYDIRIRASSDNGGDPITEHFRFIPRRKNPKASMEMIEFRLGEKARELEKWIDKNITIEPDLHHNPNILVKYRFESKLLEINNFCATYRLENGKPYSVPLEKILLTRDDEHNHLMLLIKP